MALYYGLQALGFGANIGGTLALVTITFPRPQYLFAFIDVLSTTVSWQGLSLILSGSRTIALLNTVDASLAMLAVQNLTMCVAIATGD
jgi:hypothetical protein